MGEDKEELSRLILEPGANREGASRRAQDLFDAIARDSQRRFAASIMGAYGNRSGSDPDRERDPRSLQSRRGSWLARLWKKRDE